MMMHEDWGMTQNYVVEDAWRSGREADLSTALRTIRL
jgi:hypothetical protein